jgi:hypothetical protein
LAINARALSGTINSGTPPKKRSACAVAPSQSAVVSRAVA